MLNADAMCPVDCLTTWGVSGLIYGRVTISRPRNSLTPTSVSVTVSCRHHSVTALTPVGSLSGDLASTMMHTSTYSSGVLRCCCGELRPHMASHQHLFIRLLQYVPTRRRPRIEPLTDCALIQYGASRFKATRMYSRTCDVITTIRVVQIGHTF